jgi:flagellar hook-length control protein FliK
VPPVASPASLLQSSLSFPPAIGPSKVTSGSAGNPASFSLLLDSDSPQPPPPRESSARPPATSTKAPSNPNDPNEPRTNSAAVKDAESAPEETSKPTTPSGEEAESTETVTTAAAALAELDTAAADVEGEDKATTENAPAALVEIAVVATPVADPAVSLQTEPAPADSQAADTAVPTTTPEEAVPAPVQTAGAAPDAPVIQPAAPTPQAAEPSDKSDRPPTPVHMAPVAEHADADGQPALATAPEEQAQPQTTSNRTHVPTAPAADQTPNPGSQISDLALAARAQPEAMQLSGLQAPRDVGQIVATTTHTIAQGNPQSASAPVSLESVAVEIASRAQAGRNRFEIRLDPPELGRIEVRLDIDRSGQVTSRLVVERAETLDVLRRDAHELERALQQAGLKTADNGLQFALRDQAFAGHGDGEKTAQTGGPAAADAEAASAESVPAGYSRVLYARGGVDIRI